MTSFANVKAMTCSSYRVPSSRSEEELDPPRDTACSLAVRVRRARRGRRPLDRDQTLTLPDEVVVLRLLDQIVRGLLLRDRGFELRVPRLFRRDLVTQHTLGALECVRLHGDPGESGRTDQAEREDRRRDHRPHAPRACRT